MSYNLILKWRLSLKLTQLWRHRWFCWSATVSAHHWELTKVKSLHQFPDVFTARSPPPPSPPLPPAPHQPEAHAYDRLKKISAHHYPWAHSVILWMLTLLLPGSWCFYYINNGAGTIHHGDMRLLIMSAPCIFTPFIRKRKRRRRG